MQNYFVQVTCDVHMKWDKEPPSYRLFVNDELFTERTWTWDNYYLEELIQIEAPAGVYTIRYELLDPSLAHIRPKNLQVVTGPATILGKDRVIIHDES